MAHITPCDELHIVITSRPQKENSLNVKNLTKEFNCKDHAIPCNPR